MNSSIKVKLRGAFRGFTYSALFSATGLALEILVFLLWGSIILLTDIVHWVVDTVLEVFAMLAIYYAIRLGKRFPWGVLVLEGAVMLLSVTIALGIYVFMIANYIMVEYSAGVVTTNSLLPAIGTALGGLLTLLAFIVQRRNYANYGLEVLRVDYTHALVDFVASALSTVGIAVVYYTRSTNAEVLFVFISMMFVMHSLVEILKDVVKTITGANVDHELSMRIYKRLLEEYEDVEVSSVIARKIGSFYCVEAKIGVKPSTNILAVHRLRGRVIRSIQSESDLVYHVDVKVYPLIASRGRRKGK